MYASIVSQKQTLVKHRELR